MRMYEALSSRGNGRRDNTSSQGVHNLCCVLSKQWRLFFFLFIIIFIQPVDRLHSAAQSRAWDPDPSNFFFLQNTRCLSFVSHSISRYCSICLSSPPSCVCISGTRVHTHTACVCVFIPPPCVSQSSSNNTPAQWQCVVCSGCRLHEIIAVLVHHVFFFWSERSRGV